MDSPAQIIDAKGAAAFAEGVQKPLGTVRVWKTRNSFPRHAWPEITAAFPDLTIEKLLELERAAG
ncbi:MAG: hypothetical protein ACM3W4_01595 [Ignavibacteriales bacterium]